MSYSTTRVEDLKDLSTPSIAPDGLKVYDTVRIFTVDNPARQFECGQQRGGNYRCICGLAAVNHSNFEAAFIQKTQSLQQRFDLFKAGTLWKTFNMQNNINPFVNLTKETLTDELDYRNLDIYNLKKPELKTLLTETLHGIQRPPALFCPNFDNTCTTENLEQYEISNCEPLHDIVNVVQNLITELPYHLDDNIQKEYLRFFEVTVGDKNELKASNARLYAIKLAHFTNMNYENGLVNADILTICNSLVEIITICYSRSNERTQKQQQIIFTYQPSSTIRYHKLTSKREESSTTQHMYTNEEEYDLRKQYDDLPNKNNKNNTSMQKEQIRTDGMQTIVICNVLDTITGKDDAKTGRQEFDRFKDTWVKENTDVTEVSTDGSSNEVVGQKRKSANSSRLITKIRWVVESVNGRLKLWRYLANIVPNTQIPHIGDDIKLVAAICNQYKPPLNSGNQEEDQLLAAKMNMLASKGNALFERVVEEKLDRRIAAWKKMDSENVVEGFPTLS
ncbi:unnamed protein product [Mytilus edulis]|uniref:DDE Tnp4 domain-containing protein n=1 Tax=Mytilus edulis TaxID=6550 RepID=A0A8S3QCA3_MYTED|nr:unnamed protein product [Mytilus edulis]